MGEGKGKRGNAAMLILWKNREKSAPKKTPGRYNKTIIIYNSISLVFVGCSLFLVNLILGVGNSGWSGCEYMPTCAQHILEEEEQTLNIFFFVV